MVKLWNRLTSWIIERRIEKDKRDQEIRALARMNRATTRPKWN